MKAEIRSAAVGDVAAIQEIGHKTWPATYSFAGNDYIAAGLAAYWSRKALLRSLDDTAVLVAVDGDEVIGVGNIDMRGDDRSSGSFTCCRICRVRALARRC